MNAKQAKELDLIEFVARLGHSPSRTRGNDIWYRSPIRPDEHTPSFKIDARKNIWYDFGLGQGGTIIDLVQLMYRTQDVAQALALITDISGGTSTARPVPLQTERSNSDVSDKPVIESVERISDATLEAYLVSRSIPPDLARIYLDQVVYRIGERTYCALAFRNNSSGYEVRNPFFKGSLGTKDITFLEVPGRHDASVFEGVLDFLSALAYSKKDRAKSNVLVLNSVGLIDRGIARLRAGEINHISTYLDHDKAGQAAFARLSEETWKISDNSGIYSEFKDFNEFLKSQWMRARDDRGDER